MKAILIDAVNREVREVHLAEGLQAIYDLLSYPDNKVSCFDCWRLDGEDAIYIDDEGLLKDVEHFFIVDGKKALAGNGLVTSHDDEGETIDVAMTVEQVEARVKFAHISTIKVLAELNAVY